MRTEINAEKFGKGIKKAAAIHAEILKTYRSISARGKNAKESLVLSFNKCLGTPSYVPIL